MMRKRGKRGISPLIASVLLIAFAIALFLIISNWVQKGVVEPRLEEGGEKVSKTLNCLSAKLEIAEVCATNVNDKVSVKVDNTGDVDVVGLKLRVVGADGVETIPADGTLKVTMPPLDREDVPAQAVDATKVGDIQSIEVFPEIEGGLCQSNVVSKKVVSKSAAC